MVVAVTRSSASTGRLGSLSDLHRGGGGTLGLVHVAVEHAVRGAQQDPLLGLLRLTHTWR